MKFSSVRIWICLIPILFFASSLSLAQQDLKSTILLKTINKDVEDVLEAQFAVSEKLNADIRKSADYFAIRVCSSRPLPIALAISRDRPLGFVSRLLSLGFSVDRIVFLRNQRLCSDKELNNHSEYWLVPQASEFPEFDEMRLGANLTHMTLWVSKRPLSHTARTNSEPVFGHLQFESFSALLSYLEKSLRIERRYLISIEYCYENGSRAVLDTNLRTLRNMMHKLGVRNSRLVELQSKFVPCGQYPSITIIKEE
jgi:hypothetical protein